MLTPNVIKALCNSVTWTRGGRLKLDGAVTELNVATAPAEITINAKVEGQSASYYRVQGKYDRKKGVLRTISCECPAFLKYSGICKHCVAVLLKCTELEAFSNPSSELPFSVLPVSGPPSAEHPFPGHSSSTPTSAPAARRKSASKPTPRPTTPELKRLLEQRISQKALLAGQQELYGKVRLEPIFFYDRKRLSAEFKIGAGRMYVVKDVIEFASHIVRQEDYEYGKNLRFVHSIQMFEESSRPLVLAVVNWVRQRIPNFGAGRYYGSNNRTISLTEENFIQFLLAVGEGSVQFNISGKKELLYEIVRGKAPRQLTIQGQKDGVLLTASPALFLSGMEYCATVADNSIYLEETEKLRPAEDFLHFLKENPGGSFFIQRSDVPAFNREILSRMEECFECRREDFDEKEYGIIPVRFQFYLDRPYKDAVSCRAAAVYGEEETARSYDLFDDKKDLLQRDREAEIAASVLLAGWQSSVSEELGRYEELPVEDGNPETDGNLETDGKPETEAKAGSFPSHRLLYLEGEDPLYAFLSGGLAQLEDCGEVFATAAFKNLTIRRQPKVTVNLSIKGGLLEFAYQAEAMEREEIREILAGYSRKKKFYRLRDGSFLDLENGDSIHTLYALKEDLNLTDAQMKSGKMTLPAYRALYVEEAVKESQEVDFYKNRECRAFLRDMKTVEDNDFSLPESLEEVMRPYQKYGFLWLKTLRHNGLGGILADDMGLGKTLQTIAFLLSESREPRPAGQRLSLVVTPASLVYNWGEEFRRFAPELTVTLAVGTAPERKALIEAAERSDVLITSYDLLKRDLELYEPLDFACQIIDEAQYIKNQGTQAAKAVKQIRSAFRLALTGTPIENRLGELWSIFDYLLPGFLYSYPVFRRRFELPASGEQGGETLARLRRMIHPFVLRRLKRDVLKDLPDKLEKNMGSEMAGEQRELYQAHVSRLRHFLEKQSDEDFEHSKLQVLSQLTLLREICCDPALVFDNYRGGSAKLELCMELIRNGVEGGHKILLFSQFTSMLERIGKRLSEEGISFYSLTGATPKKERMRLMQAFQQDVTSVFCISLKAGGTGLNLTAADMVIHFDPWWNLAVQNQASDRAHRIGQKQVVTVYRLIANGSIEEQIVKLQEKKRDLAEQVLQGETMGSGSFTREDLMEILGAPGKSEREEVTGK